jgi:hypothetical protein
MTNNNNNFYTIAAFSLSREINNIQHIIASSYFTDSIEHFDFNKIDERLQLLDCKKLVLVYVTEADSVTKTIRYGKSINTDFIYHSISFANFFTNSFLSEYFYSKKDMTAKNMIFIFENRRWNELLVQFRRFNILISGGSSGKRHILSPVQHRLSQFITCVEGMNTTKIVDSFHYSEKWNSRPTINLATKNMNEAIKELNEDLITTPQEGNLKDKTEELSPSYFISDGLPTSSTTSKASIHRNEANNKVNILRLNITQKREYLSYHYAFINKNSAFSINNFALKNQFCTTTIKNKGNNNLNEPLTIKSINNNDIELIKTFNKEEYLYNKMKSKFHLFSLTPEDLNLFNEIETYPNKVFEFISYNFGFKLLVSIELQPNMGYWLIKKLKYKTKIFKLIRPKVLPKQKKGISLKTATHTIQQLKSEDNFWKFNKEIIWTDTYFFTNLNNNDSYLVNSLWLDCILSKENAIIFRSCFKLEFYKNKNKGLRLNKILILDCYSSKFEAYRFPIHAELSQLLLLESNKNRIILPKYSLDIEREYLNSSVLNSNYLKDNKSKNFNLNKSLKTNNKINFTNKNDLKNVYLHGYSSNWYYYSFLMIETNTNNYGEYFTVILVFNHITGKIINYHYITETKDKYKILKLFIVKELNNNYNLFKEDQLKFSLHSNKSEGIYTLLPDNLLDSNDFKFKIMVPYINNIEINNIENNIENNNNNVYNMEFICNLAQSKACKAFDFIVYNNKDKNIPPVISQIIKDIKNAYDPIQINLAINNFNLKLIKKIIKLEKKKKKT